MDPKIKNVFLIMVLVAVIATMTIPVTKHAYADKTHHRGHGGHSTGHHTATDKTGHHFGDTSADPTATDKTSADPTATDKTGHHSGTDAINNLLNPNTSIINPSSILSKLVGTNTGTSSLSGTGFP